MKVYIKKPPREYEVGLNKDIKIKDCATIKLESNEQVTFIDEDKREYDLCRKSWGYYATPSINSRLYKFNFKTALVKNSKDQYYVMLVEKDKIDDFNNYIENDQNELIEWLDERNTDES